ncbi:unnamed protein product [Enterobius vermicularis]|uniref:NR LBD domain-containing protein n=1 Tax=Enterobius vermicularis TaxID=51028 RepID=A0A0N4VEU1_ENTVE|nr:unnamed protein product [Enterobius vermicularis]
MDNPPEESSLENVNIKPLDSDYTDILENGHTVLSEDQSEIPNEFNTGNEMEVEMCSPDRLLHEDFIDASDELLIVEPRRSFDFNVELLRATCESLYEGMEASEAFLYIGARLPFYGSSNVCIFGKEPFPRRIDETRTLGPVECDLPCSSNSLKPALFSPATSQLNFVSCNGAGMAQQSETDGIASEVYNWLPKKRYKIDLIDRHFEDFYSRVAHPIIRAFKTTQRTLFFIDRSLSFFPGSLEHLAQKMGLIGCLEYFDRRLSQTKLDMYSFAESFIDFCMLSEDAKRTVVKKTFFEMSLVAYSVTCAMSNKGSLMTSNKILPSTFLGFCQEELARRFDAMVASCLKSLVRQSLGWELGAVVCAWILNQGMKAQDTYGYVPKLEKCLRYKFRTFEHPEQEWKYLSHTVYKLRRTRLMYEDLSGYAHCASVCQPINEPHLDLTPVQYYPV